MSKYCKPIGLYVTYLDCMECEEKECIQFRENRKGQNMKRIYLNVDIGQEVYLIFASKREKYDNDIVIKCKVTKAIVYEKETVYCCEPIKFMTKTKEDLKNYVSSFMFENANLNTGYRSGFNRYPVFTTKEDCINWLKKK